ncbi:MAG: hypothetical protein HYY37_04390 [Candidatus Aenigmarchaeota archaeon]|nr:hypothetical protein [Candidatus Aenigmarchaeota archaeon]
MMRKTERLHAQKYTLILLALILVAIGVYMYTASPQTQQSPPDYPRQSEDVCAAGGAQWKEFRSGCHDECWIVRSKKIVHCTLALSYGCDCGEGKCWNGTACEPD